MAVRVRPLPNDSCPQQPSVRCTSTSLTLSPGKSETTYGFDLVFGEDSTQEAVYAEVGAPILRKALQGFNATIFAYGQVGRRPRHRLALPHRRLLLHHQHHQHHGLLRRRAAARRTR